MLLYPGRYETDRTTTPLIASGGDLFEVDGFAQTSVERIAEDVDRDRFMNSEEAKAYGLVSRIVTSIAEI